MAETIPRMMTIRAVAATGVLPEHALRMMARQGQLPCIYIGSKCLVNYDQLLAYLNTQSTATQHISNNKKEQKL